MIKILYFFIIFNKSLIIIMIFILLFKFNILAIFEDYFFYFFR